MAISNCVYPENEVKRILERRLLYSSRRRKIANQTFILGDVEFRAAQILPPKVILGLTFGRFNHRGGKVSADSLCNVNPAAVQRRNQVEGDSSRLRNQIPGYECRPGGLAEARSRALQGKPPYNHDREDN